ncbi:MAG TPA: hypothetical protein ENN68_09530 [Methanomicrobia archaeon]|nr:hypothetical protein [Methanomicrobia archaeon]
MRRVRSTGNGKNVLIMLFLLILVSSVFCAGMMSAVQGADVGGVTRSVLSDPVPGAEFEVTLTMDAEPPLVVGIRETIPDGFDFVSTTCKNHEVSGHELAFVVMDETVVSYRIKAPASGTGTFTGTWIDLLGAGEGSIAATTVVVGGGEMPSTSAQPGTSTETPRADSEPAVPGFGVLSLIVSLVTVLLVLIVLRSTGGRRE